MAGLTVSAVVATLICMTGPYVVDLGLVDKRLPFLVFTIFGVFGIVFTSLGKRVEFCEDHVTIICPSPGEQRNASGRDHSRHREDGERVQVLLLEDLEDWAGCRGKCRSGLVRRRKRDL